MLLAAAIFFSDWYGLWDQYYKVPATETTAVIQKLCAKTVGEGIEIAMPSKLIKTCADLEEVLAKNRAVGALDHHEVVGLKSLGQDKFEVTVDYKRLKPHEMAAQVRVVVEMTTVDGSLRIKKYTPLLSTKSAKIQQEVKTLMNGYLTAFQSLSAAETLQYYHIPSSVGTDTGLVLLGTEKEAENFLIAAFTSLQKVGYTNSRWKALTVHVLSDNQAIVSSQIERFKGSELLSVSAAIYHVSRKSTESPWKITFGTGHSTETFLTF